MSVNACAAVIYSRANIQYIAHAGSVCRKENLVMTMLAFDIAMRRLIAILTSAE